MKKLLFFTCLAGSMFALHAANAAETENTTTSCGCDDFPGYIRMLKEWEKPEELSQLGTMHWKGSYSYSVPYSSKKFISFRMDQEYYSGGAHGMTTTKVGTIMNGQVLKLANLSPKIRPLWEKAIAKHFKAKSYEEYLRSNPYEKPFMTENFYLDAKGIHFIYNPYEIDCFGAGTIDIFVPCKTE